MFPSVILILINKETECLLYCCLQWVHQAWFPRPRHLHNMALLWIAQLCTVSNLYVGVASALLPWAKVSYVHCRFSIDFSFSFINIKILKIEAVLQLNFYLLNYWLTIKCSDPCIRDLRKIGTLDKRRFVFRHFVESWNYPCIFWFFVFLHVFA